MKFIILLCLTVTTLFAADGSKGNAWHGFRGDGDSHSRAQNLPLTWSETQNIAWRADLEGFGQSSPVIWRDKVYLTTVANGVEEPLALYCLNIETGERLWRRTFPASQTYEYTRMHARAAPTPVVDEQGITIFFGSGDLIKLDHKGNELWSRSLVNEFGEIKGNHGVASSPVLHKKTLYLLIAHEGPSYLMAMNAKTGETLWRTERDPKVSWTTPLVTRFKGQDQLIISSNGILEAVDTKTGKQLWFTNKVTRNTAASPSRYKDLIIIGSSEADSTMAVRLGGSGDITESHVIWRGSWPSSFGSPLISGDAVYMVNRAGVLVKMSAETGEELWKHRAPDSYWASPIAVGDRLYFFAKNGSTLVMDANAAEPNILATNELPVEKDDEVYGAAVVDERILIRTGSQLVCVSI